MGFFGARFFQGGEGLPKHRAWRFSEASGRVRTENMKYRVFRPFVYTWYAFFSRFVEEK